MEDYCYYIAVGSISICHIGLSAWDSPEFSYLALMNILINRFTVWELGGVMRSLRNVRIAFCLKIN